MPPTASPRRRPGFLVGSLAVAAVLAACGGGGDDTDGVSARTWAGGVCGQIVAWQERIQSLGTDLESSIQGTAGNLQATRTQLVEFMDDVVRSTEQMVQSIEDDGVPDVEDGEQISNDLRQGLDQVRQAFADGKAKAEDLPIDNQAAFQQGAGDIAGDIREAGQKVNEEFNELDDKYDVPSLDEAFQQSPECQPLNS